MGQREESIRSLFDTSGLGLEIGPSYNPIVPKRDGYQVHTIDHAPAEELRKKYATETAVNAALIEDVDFVWDGRPLSELVGGTARYDYVVASHVIEHTPDMLGFLLECQTLLKPDGVLVLAVPDKRRCFDIFRPFSSTGQVMQAHAERRTVHLAASAFDQGANMVTRQGVSGWTVGSDGEFAFIHSVEVAKTLFDRSIRSKEYYDFHAWVYTPSSFRLIMSDLNKLGLLAIRERTFETTAGAEFIVTLGQDAPGCPLDRMSLLKEIQRDLRECVEQVA